MDINLRTNLDRESHYNSATSPLSDLPIPSKTQAQAGEYHKARIDLKGLVINVENPYGSIRSGVDKNGKAWAIELKDSYGEIHKTEGADGDAIDIFIKPHLTPTDIETLDKIYVIDQINPDTGEFDEHKCVFGYTTTEDATNAYLSNYTKGWKGLGAITPLDITVFKLWLKKGNLNRPIAYKSDISTLEEAIKINPLLKGLKVGDNVTLKYDNKSWGSSQVTAISTKTITIANLKKKFALDTLISTTDPKLVIVPYDDKIQAIWTKVQKELPCITSYPNSKFTDAIVKDIYEVLLKHGL